MKEYQIFLVLTLATTFATGQGEMDDGNDPPPPPPLSGKLTTKPCEGGDDCGQSDDFCGKEKEDKSFIPYTTCGIGGVCHCVDRAKQYDGFTAEAFKNGTLCKAAPGGSDCLTKCKGVKRALTYHKKAYVCRVDDEDRCFCEFRIKRDKLESCDPTGKNKPDDKICKDGGNCKDKKAKCFAGVTAGVAKPPNCKCTEGYSPDGVKNCKEDAYCYNTCDQSTTAAPGKACPGKTSGKWTCVCDKTPEK